MSRYRAALLVLVVIGWTLAVALPAGATTAVGADGTEGTDAVDRAAGRTDASGEPGGLDEPRWTSAANASPNGTNETSLGTDISSFMQSSAAEVEGAVESGMWSVAFNDTGNRSVQVKLVERRTAELRSQLADLRERKEELLAEREAGNVSETAYRARIGRLVGRINALNAAINATESRADVVDADVEALESLRTDARNLTGPEISSAVRGVSGVDVETVAPGPPDDANASKNETTGPPNGGGNDSNDWSDVGRGSDEAKSAVGQGTDASAKSDVGSETGRSDDAGAKSDAGSDANPGNEAGSESDVGAGTGNDVGAGTKNDVGAGNSAVSGSETEIRRSFGAAKGTSPRIDGGPGASTGAPNASTSPDRSGGRTGSSGPSDGDTSTASRLSTATTYVTVISQRTSAPTWPGR